MTYPVAQAALAVARGELTELDALRRLAPFGYPKFDVFAWLRAARQPISPGYGERTPLGSSTDPVPARGRHEGGNLPRPLAAGGADGGRVSSPFVRARGGRSESAATRQGI